MRTEPPSLAVGNEYDNVQLLKQACREFALENVFEFNVNRTSKTRCTISCKAEGCPWRLYASPVEDTAIFRISTYHAEHTCFGIHHPGNKVATTQHVANLIADKLQEQPSYRPVDIVRDIKQQLGIKVSYIKAFRAKDRALEAHNGTHEDTYAKLPKYCADVEKTNLNSKAFVERNDNNKFRRLFVCYGACATGFAHCRPILGLDVTHLKHKYQGILLAATAVDANGALFPLCYSVVDAENDDNWLWFLRTIRDIVEKHASNHVNGARELVLLSDRQKGLLDAVEQVFPGHPHGYCPFVTSKTTFTRSLKTLNSKCCSGKQHVQQPRPPL